MVIPVGEEQLLIDLESLATLAAARAIEVTPPTTTESFPPLRRTLNLRRKWKWTPQHEPVSLSTIPEPCLYTCVLLTPYHCTFTVTDAEPVEFTLL